MDTPAPSDGGHTKRTGPDQARHVDVDQPRGSSHGGHESTIPEGRSPRAVTFSLLFLLSLLVTSFFAGEDILSKLKKILSSIGFGPPKPPTPSLYPSFPVDITSMFNNIAAGPNADFDPHSHGAYPTEYLPTNEFIYDRIRFIMPKTWADGKPDNLLLRGGEIKLGQNSGFTREMHILYAGDWINGESGAKFAFNFEDGTTEEVEVSIKNWWTLHWLNQGVIQAPYHITPEGINHNLTQIYHWSTAIRTTSPLASISLPTSSWPNHVHLFAMTLVPSLVPPSSSPNKLHLPQGEADIQRPLTPFGGSLLTSSAKAFAKPSIVIRRAVYTTKWTMIHGFKAYMVQVFVSNPLPGLLALDEEMWVRGQYYIGVGGPGVETARFGVVRRIMPSDEIKVKIWIVSLNGVDPSTIQSATVTVKDEEGSVVASLATTDVARSFSQDLAVQDTPEWWDDAKFGIFIHWGLYSVPGWAPDGWYGEWYDWWLHKWPNPSNGFWKHHLDTYGQGLVYDDFIANFTASKFNASEWVNLFANAGAKYFIPVTKHHDGFALFDTKETTYRSSWHLGPRRDFIRELFDIAKKETPELKRGTYFTMPEWYNPDAGRGGYGFGDWPGQLARNAFDDTKTEPYTGHIYGKDYLRDIQLEQMRMLAMDYETEIMWCDIGGPNLSKEFAREWYPFAEKRGRQVVMNNRCGDIPQYDTPEFTRFSSIQRTAWETNESIDPYSYGYNRRTRSEQYRSVETILHTMIDIVSKNGNYLLNLGPTGEGNFVKPMVDRMIEVGKWMKHSANDCIYGTNYFFLGAEDRSLRFTQKGSTFCIIALSRPEKGVLVVERQVPILEGDSITLLGGGHEGKNLTWWKRDHRLMVGVPEEALNRVNWAWAFKIDFAP